VPAENFETRTGFKPGIAAFCRLVFLQLPSDQQDVAEACGSRTQTFDSQVAANDDVAASVKSQLESVGVNWSRENDSITLQKQIGSSWPLLALLAGHPRRAVRSVRINSTQLLISPKPINAAKVSLYFLVERTEWTFWCPVFFSRF